MIPADALEPPAGPCADRDAPAGLFQGCAELARLLGRDRGQVVELGGAGARARWAGGSLECASLAYALTTEADWHRAVGEAIGLLKPGGILGVVDFYVSCPQRRPGMAHHGWIARKFWKHRLRRDGMRLSCEHLPCLQARLETLHLAERRAPLPGLRILAAPYYVFIGRKPHGAGPLRLHP